MKHNFLQNKILCCIIFIVINFGGYGMGQMGFQENKFSDKKNKEIYEKLWFGKRCVFEKVENSVTNKGETSYNSYRFKIDGVENNKSKKDVQNKVCDFLIEFFNISSKEQFSSKFKESCSGSGNEMRKITTLHSSSLCALLFFYNVSEKNPFEFNGIEDIKDIKFTEVHFEFQNCVVKDGNPSNVDIVLKGKKGDKNVILFLESKFSEYLKPGKQEVREAYLDSEKVFLPYTKKLLNDLDMDSDFDEKGDFKLIEKMDNKTKSEYKVFSIHSKPRKPACYAEGIKQMISHFIGVCNFIKRNRCDSRFKNDDFGEVYLGEIVFKWEDIKDSRQNFFEGYSKKYKKLAEVLNNRENKAINKAIENDNKTKFFVLPNLITYQDIKTIKTDGTKILDFYKLN